MTIYSPGPQKLCAYPQNAVEYKSSGVLGGDVLPIITPSNITISQLVKDGKYDWSNADITDEHFPINPTFKWANELILIHYGCILNRQAVLNDFKKQGLRVAEPAEILVFGITYPDKQREFSIVALGSPWMHSYYRRYHMLVLYERGGRRELGLFYFGRAWGIGYRFLAARLPR